MPDDAPTIRQARAEDDPVLAELDRRCWSLLSDVAPRREPDAPFFDERHLPGRHLVAELGGRITGYIRIARPTPLDSNAHVRQIQGLGVDAELRGRGIGRALVEAACTQARSEGARRLTLRVLGHNLPARRLYERCGFLVEGLLPEEFLLDGTYVDDIWMGRSLVDPDPSLPGAGKEGY